jgi:hypothetical protein
MISASCVLSARGSRIAGLACTASAPALTSLLTVATNWFAPTPLCTFRDTSSTSTNHNQQQQVRAFGGGYYHHNRPFQQQRKKVRGGKGAPNRFVRVGESLFRVQNYRLAFKKYFPGKQFDNTSWNQRMARTREHIWEKKVGKTESYPEREYRMQNSMLERKL